MDKQIEQERQVNDVMNELDDALDSEEEDTSYLVNANASTGGAEKSPNENLAHSYYPEEKADYSYQDNYNYNKNAPSNEYDNNYSNQYNNGLAENDYQQYAQNGADDYNYNQNYN